MNFKYNKGAAYLSESDWLKTCTFLEPYCLKLKNMAQELGFDMRISKIWPSYEFTKNGLFFYTIMRFSLNPDYLNDEKITFHCYFYKYKKIFLFKTNEIISKEDFFILTKEEMTNEKYNLEKIYKCAVKVLEY
ncbi:hypothetical protein [Cellvibrio japonicus]|uniref:Uncharacterized protein n=1 Tax=Cellvibrio japonicus (strain Ueda107) TaxID=498211 RepID=B3PJ46_CELJU|nr:hypothetical protein [Cellvibrio japonicus]ACE84118.1 hypothetical protein CJA_0557 [Cellvibrio japonicus Ueda107]QEI11245.1 hypothetical protein FY117_02680 [Cellvibrio japonicus]QEI14819.1 hypothetical protein FY116_02680 [Cellvibrio japonicus]QEI18399.1 hypothetical protein FY115_02680 [Cellvibrio japonicus]